MAKSAA